MHKTGTAEVERVDAESQADLAGVKPGWKIVEVNGEKVDASNAQEKTEGGNGKFVIQFMVFNLCQLKSLSPTLIKINVS